MKVLNLSHDNMFLERFSNYLEIVNPGRNEYVVLTAGTELKHKLSGATVTPVASANEAREYVKAAAADCDLLIIHYMFPAWARLFPEITRQIRTVWSGFGGDYYYAEGDPRGGLLAPLTSEVYQKTAPRRSLVGKIADEKRRYFDRIAMRRAAASVDYFSAPIRSDADTLRARYPNFQGEYRQLNYGTTAELITSDSLVVGDDVLVGNSASYTNNHLDVFEQLRKSNPDGRKIVVPLSYGEPAEYRSAVLKSGQQLFGSDFEPLLEFLPLAEYNAIVSSCSKVLMGHRRQQGLGNILTALLSGCTVFLDDRNPVYTELVGRGMNLKKLSQLESSTLESIRVEPQQAQENREIVEAVWGEQTVLENVSRLLS